MIKVLLADDQELIRQSLSFVMSRQEDIEMVGTAANGREALELVEEKQPDVVLLDIRMPEMDGVECTRRIKQEFPGIKVIILTTFDDDDYVFDAFDLFAFQYLLKPLDEEKFEKILKMAAAECEEHTDEKALFFHTKTDHIRVCPSQIFYVESNLRKVVIHTEKEAFEIYATMNDLEKHLGSRFYRCHRGFLVNLEKINSYNRQTIRLTDGSSLLLSKTRYSEFVDTYMHFLKRGEQ